MPSPNAGPWGDSWLGFGCLWADTELGVSIYTGSSWGGVPPRTVPDNGNCLGERLSAGTRKVVIGRMKEDGGDSADNAGPTVRGYATPTARLWVRKR
ncbi:hypothetical protein [Streptomyces sp. Ncost-T10-10d]|uniref:hypothetical protein n=1 Tax=Streptomyces sp. Ncost-T10-10d TaxID=1839774 RepID=UPI00081EC58A|nr:hypothetical protein [Streptomyces sp. Ncost-T10-10d]SCF74557.1 hypothetical protein GA0115254_115536 [Streptomyces sp. Ncost-T10-10d]